MVLRNARRRRRLTVKTTTLPLLRRRDADVPAGIGEADGVRHEVEEDLADALRVDMERADVLRHGELERDPLLAQPVAQALDRRARRRSAMSASSMSSDMMPASTVARSRMSLMRARSASRRRDDVVHVFALLGVELAERLVGEQLGLADDVGERRAQLVGDVLDEVGLQPVGRFQRLVPLLQHALDAGGIGHVDEGQHGHAFGKRDRRVVDDAAVGARHAADGLIRVVDVGHGGADRVPRRLVGIDRLAGGDDLADMRLGREAASATAARYRRRRD